MSKKTLLLIVLGLFAAYAILASGDYAAFTFGRGAINDSELASTNQEDFIAGSQEKFELLSSQRSSSCSLKLDAVMTYSDDARIQGSCCSAMDFHKYQEQVTALTNFADISQIPTDPYDIPVSLAKELFGYKKSINLSDAQQAIYDGAMSMSDEGGPCCCKCWRWDAFEGLAKYLITQHNFTSAQVAEVWDFVDGCGGPGHQHA